MCAHTEPIVLCTHFQGDDRNILKVFVAGREVMPQGTGTFTISFVNNSPRVVGSDVTVDVSVNTPTQSLTCHLRGVSGVSQEFSNEQDCEYINNLEISAYSSLILLLMFHLLGSSLSVLYPNLNAGKYVLRVVGIAVTGERDVLRREFQIGNLMQHSIGIRTSKGFSDSPLTLIHIDSCTNFYCM